MAVSEAGFWAREIRQCLSLGSTSWAPGGAVREGSMWGGEGRRERPSPTSSLQLRVRKYRGLGRGGSEGTARGNTAELNRQIRSRIRSQMLFSVFAKVAGLIKITIKCLGLHSSSAGACRWAEDRARPRDRLQSRWMVGGRGGG